MANLEATFCVMPSVLTDPIRKGEIVPEGVLLNVLEPESIDANSRRMLDVEFDIGEMAFGTYARAVDDGVPILGLPLFTSGRRFLQPGFHFAARSGIRDLAELKGRTVAAPQYWMSSTVWQRQILRQRYGIGAEDLRWVTLQPERGKLGVPSGIPHRFEDGGRSVQDLAVAGEIDASFTTGGGREPVGDALVPAFPDRVAAQRDYFHSTGIFPIMHITVMRRDLAEREPWVVGSICEAYQHAKEAATAGREPTRSASPTAGETTEEMLELMGDDPWPYGISANRKTLEAFVEAAYEQKLTSRRYGVEELFPSSLPDAFK
jgi:4,5-dihydroxyphthalate decarboxylase